MIQAAIRSSVWTSPPASFEHFEAFPVPRPNVYQIVSDAQNNGWFMVMGREDVGKIDAKTERSPYTRHRLPIPALAEA